MPTYEYECLNCGRRTEVVQRFSDEPLRECPHCGGPLRKVFHPVGIVLKGSGFYSTDNRSGSKHRSSEPKKESDTKSDTKSETTKETKSDPSTSSSKESGSSSKKSGGSEKAE
jgi:putative FmdB family regulatory protein